MNNYKIKLKEGLNFKALILPLILMILGIILIFGSDSIFKIKNAHNIENTEQRLATMINDLEGVSDSEVMLLFNESGNVSGAAVICNGGNDSQNQKNIIDMITSLFGVGASDVFVGGR